MFERFTDRARRTVVLAQEQSRLMGHNYIGVEHLLLGLIYESDGVAATTLERVGVTLQPAVTAIENRVGLGPGACPGNIPIMPQTKTVLELSLREALQLGHNYIGTEHLLLGLIRDGHGVAVEVLVKDFGLSLQDLRREVINALANASSTPSRPPSPQATIVLGDDAITAFIEWADEFSRVNGPLAAKHPLSLVRTALKARTRPMIDNPEHQEEVEHMGAETPQSAPDEEAPATEEPAGEKPEGDTEAAPE